MNYYEILKVSKNASEQQIKDSYKMLIKKYHPDIYKGNKEFAEKTSAELNNAYSVLSDPKKRAEYDLSLLPSNDTLDNTSTSSTYSSYQNYKYYQQTYEEQRQEKENWNQNFKKKLYKYVDDHTKNLSQSTRIVIVLIVIFIALLFLLLSIMDYLKIIKPI